MVHLKRWTHFFETFWLDQTDPLSFGPKFLEILVEWIAPCESCLACQHFISKLLIGHLPREQNNGKGMFFSVEQAFVGRDEIRGPLKMPAWEATFQAIIVKHHEIQIND